MDFFTKEKMLFWCVVILMLLNAATLSSFWLRRPPMGLEGAPVGGRIMEEQLQLSAAQTRQFEQIRDKHFLQTDPLQQEMHEIRMALLEEIFAAEPNETMIATLCEEIGQTQCQFDRELFHHFSELKNTCKDQQVTKLKHLLTNLLTELLENRRLPDPKQPHPRPVRGPEPGHPPPPR